MTERWRKGNRWSVGGVGRAAASLRNAVVARTWKPPWGSGTPPARLTATQELFCEWNAGRLQISVDDSRQRYRDSWRSIHGGHGGDEFRWFSSLSYQIFSVLYDDRPGELMGSYEFYGPLHFLRMLSYDEPSWDDDDPIVRALLERGSLRILDFGCGLAQGSRTLAGKLGALGRNVELVLVDIPTMRKPFLLWACERTGLSAVFLDCTAGKPIPSLPVCDICMVTNVMEHLPQPLTYLNAFDQALRPGGLLLTDLSDHRPEFMHISPSLAVVRDRLTQLAYEAVAPYRLYRKRF